MVLPTPSFTARFSWQPWLRLFSVSLVLTGFGLLGLRCLDRLPASRVDEPWLMQPAWEWLRHGQPGLPMFRYIGGNIEHCWLTSPVLFASTAAVFKVLGLGLWQARLYNLALALATLLCLYLVVRRWYGHWTALGAMALLALDGNFLYWSRVYRSDIPTVCFCWMALVLAAEARDRVIPYRVIPFGRSGFWFLSGLMASAAVLIHPNGLLVFGLLLGWMVMEEGLAIYRRPVLPAFIAGALILGLPCLLYLVNHWQEFVEQWSINQERLRGATRSGLWLNLTGEWQRYSQWSKAWTDLGHPAGSLALILAISVCLAVATLLWQAARRWRHGLRLWSGSFLIVGLFGSGLFLALSDSRKAAYYLPYITPWLAACLAVQGAAFARWARDRWAGGSIPFRGFVGGVVGLALIFGLSLIYTAGRFYQQAPQLAPPVCTDAARQLRDLVPPDAVPTGQPIDWLAFADDSVNSERFIVFNRWLWQQPAEHPYAVIVGERGLGCKKTFRKLLEHHPEDFQQLGEIADGCYGHITVFLMRPHTQEAADKDR